MKGRRILSDRLKGFYTALDDVALGDAFGFTLLFCWMELDTTAAMLNSRLAYLNIGMLAIAFLACFGAVAIVRPVRLSLAGRIPSLAVGAAACVSGLLFTFDTPDSATRMAALCVQYGCCGALLAARIARMGRHGTQTVLATCSAALVFAACVQVALLLAVYALGMLENTANVTTLSLRVLAFLPALSCAPNPAHPAAGAAGRDGSRKAVRSGGGGNGLVDAGKPDPDGARNISSDESREIAPGSAHGLEAPANPNAANESQPGATENTPRPRSAFVVSAIVLCVGTFACGFFTGATFSPHLYDFVWIASAGAIAAGIVGLVGLVAFAAAPADSCERGALVWGLLCTLALCVCALASFTFADAGTAPAGIALVYAAHSVLLAMTIALACIIPPDPDTAGGFAFALLVGGGFLYACALGLHVKHEIGHSVSLLMPYITIAISVLAVLYLLQGGMSATRGLQPTKVLAGAPAGVASAPSPPLSAAYAQAVPLDRPRNGKAGCEGGLSANQDHHANTALTERGRLVQPEPSGQGDPPETDGASSAEVHPANAPALGSASATWQHEIPEHPEHDSPATTDDNTDAGFPPQEDRPPSAQLPSEPQKKQATPAEQITDANERIDALRLEALAPYQFTPREKDVAVRVLRGMSYADIGEDLSISVKTVSFHLTSVYRKTNVGGKPELAALVDDIMLAKESSKNGEPAKGLRSS